MGCCEHQGVHELDLGRIGPSQTIEHDGLGPVSFPGGP